MATDDRERFLAATRADEDEARAFLREIFEKFVTVEKGITEETADGREMSVTSGLDVLRLFGARRDVLTRVMEAVHAENTLDASQKKVWRSPSDSSTGSRRPAKGRAGRRRATTASRAATEASAGNEGATSRTPAASSGSPATSAPRGVPSVN